MWNEAVRRWTRCIPAFVVFAGLALPVAESAQVQRQVVSGKELAGWATDANGPGKALFSGFVLGVHDAFNEIMFCTTDEVDRQQIENAVSGFLKDRQDLIYKFAADLVRQALKEAFPCER